MLYIDSQFVIVSSSSQFSRNLSLVFICDFNDFYTKCCHPDHDIKKRIEVEQDPTKYVTKIKNYDIKRIERHFTPTIHQTILDLCSIYERHFSDDLLNGAYVENGIRSLITSTQEGLFIINDDTSTEKFKEIILESLTRKLYNIGINQLIKQGHLEKRLVKSHLP